MFQNLAIFACHFRSARDGVGKTKEFCRRIFADLMECRAYMADHNELRITGLSELSPLDLEPILVQETADWAQELDWDHSKLADLVRRLSAARKLGGAALLDRGEVAGYGYLGLEGHKGLIADAYVRPAWRGENAESTLLRVLFDRLIGMPSVNRIEAQLMLVEAASARILEQERGVHLFERTLMTLDSDTRSLPRPSPPTPGFRIEPWDDRHLRTAAEVIALAYRDRIDAFFHERYRTASGAEKFLEELIDFPSASFCRPASRIAFETGSGSAAGISLAGFVAQDVGHIAELCVIPRATGVGLGRQLLRRSIDSLCEAGAKRISLAVTIVNDGALRLYRQFGFREKRKFLAYVWERS